MTEPMTFRRIMVPVDFSAPSREAIAYAAGLARPAVAEILLVHVLEPIVMLTGAIGEHAVGPIDTEWQVKHAEERLRDVVAKHVVPGVPMKTLLRFGRPFEEIVAAAKEERADLIVIASAGHSRVAYAILGSTVERVARLAPCPVLITRKVAPAEPK